MIIFHFGMKLLHVYLSVYKSLLWLYFNMIVDIFNVAAADEIVELHGEH